MPKKVRTDRIRKQDAARQQARRDREAAGRERIGAQKTKFTSSQSTRDDIAVMQQVGGFEQDEAISLALRWMAGLARRDAPAFLAAMDPRNPV